MMKPSTTWNDCSELSSLSMMVTSSGEDRSIDEGGGGLEEEEGVAGKGERVEVKIETEKKWRHKMRQGITQFEKNEEGRCGREDEGRRGGGEGGGSEQERRWEEWGRGKERGNRGGEEEEGGEGKGGGEGEKGVEGRRREMWCRMGRSRGREKRD